MKSSRRNSQFLLFLPPYMWYNLTLEYVPQRVPRGAERVFTMGLFTKLFGTRSEREVKKLEPQVEAVMALEEPYKKLTDQELRAKTQEFKDRYASGETLDALLPEAFAVCREAADRVLGMRPYRVQVVGGIVLQFLRRRGRDTLRRRVRNH